MYHLSASRTQRERFLSLGEGEQGNSRAPALTRLETGPSSGFPRIFSSVLLGIDHTGLLTSLLFSFSFSFHLRSNPLSFLSRCLALVHASRRPNHFPTLSSQPTNFRPTSTTALLLPQQLLLRRQDLSNEPRQLDTLKPRQLSSLPPVPTQPASKVTPIPLPPLPLPLPPTLEPLPLPSPQPHLPLHPIITPRGSFARTLAPNSRRKGRPRLSPLSSLPLFRSPLLFTRHGYPVEDLPVPSLSRTGVIQKEESTLMEFPEDLEPEGREQEREKGRRRRLLEKSEEGRDEEVEAPTRLEVRAIRYRVSGTRTTPQEPLSSQEPIIPTTASNE